MSEGLWTKRSHQVLRDHFRSMPFCLTEKELRQRMRPWYPFGRRKDWPYRCWLRACKQWREAYFQGRNEVVISKRRKRKQDVDTIEMFPEYVQPRRRRT